jgi:hypothetical protein
MKLAYFRSAWKDKPEWIEHAEQTVERVWQTSYRGQSAAVVPVEAGQEEDDEGPLSEWERQERRQLVENPDETDAMEVFQRDPPVRGSMKDVVGYWVARRQEPKLRDLARMALDYLTIPAMSAELERVFSAAKITLSQRRCALGDDVINALECLKSWQRDGMIAASCDDIRELESMLDALCEDGLEKERKARERTQRRGGNGE